MVYNNKTVWNANQDSVNQQSLTADTHPSVQLQIQVPGGGVEHESSEIPQSLSFSLV